MLRMLQVATLLATVSTIAAFAAQPGAPSDVTPYKLEDCISKQQLLAEVEPLKATHPFFIAEGVDGQALLRAFNALEDTHYLASAVAVFGFPIEGNYVVGLISPDGLLACEARRVDAPHWERLMRATLGRDA